MTKTKLMFAASNDAVHGYVARVVIDGKPQPIVPIAPSACEITIESAVGSKVAVAIATVGEQNGEKVTSQAKTFLFTTADYRLPTPPGDIFVRSVIPALPVIEDVPQTPPTPDRLMISGDVDLYDGSIGEIVGPIGGGQNARYPNGLAVLFPRKACRNPGPEGDQFSKMVYHGDASQKVKIIKADQSMIDLDAYLDALPADAKINEP